MGFLLIGTINSKGQYVVKNPHKDGLLFLPKERRDWFSFLISFP